MARARDHDTSASASAAEEVPLIEQDDDIEDDGIPDYTGVLRVHPYNAKDIKVAFDDALVAVLREESGVTEDETQLNFKCFFGVVLNLIGGALGYIGFKMDFLDPVAIRMNKILVAVYSAIWTIMTFMEIFILPRNALTSFDIDSKKMDVRTELDPLSANYIISLQDRKLSKSTAVKKVLPFAGWLQQDGVILNDDIKADIKTALAKDISKMKTD